MQVEVMHNIYSKIHCGITSNMAKNNKIDAVEKMEKKSNISPRKSNLGYYCF